MTATVPNGLASLKAQRERARRSMPPPRHPVPTERTITARKSPDKTSQPVEQSTELPPPAQEPATPRPLISPETTGTTFKVTLYVDQQTDEYMEAARIEGLTSRPKVDVSRSAVVRLAVRRLMDDMSPREVKSLLERQAVRSTGPGRKRR